MKSSQHWKAYRNYKIEPQIRGKDMITFEKSLWDYNINQTFSTMIVQQDQNEEKQLINNSTTSIKLIILFVIIQTF